MCPRFHPGRWTKWSVPPRVYSMSSKLGCVRRLDKMYAMWGWWHFLWCYKRLLVPHEYLFGWTWSIKRWTLLWEDMQRLRRFCLSRTCYKLGNSMLTLPCRRTIIQPTIKSLCVRMWWKQWIWKSEWCSNPVFLNIWGECCKLTRNIWWCDLLQPNCTRRLNHAGLPLLIRNDQRIVHEFSYGLQS